MYFKHTSQNLQPLKYTNIINTVNQTELLKSYKNNCFSGYTKLMFTYWYYYLPILYNKINNGGIKQTLIQAH